MSLPLAVFQDFPMATAIRSHTTNFAGTLELRQVVFHAVFGNAFQPFGNRLPARGRLIAQEIEYLFLGSLLGSFWTSSSSNGFYIRRCDSGTRRDS